ncbi:MFS transporter [Nonomuraea sp. NPDC059023]|uniref:MFS transporter n=1 Tax=unclassified Nonomuraea TaxID=2593643 RepID=UPI0036C75A7C
MVAAATVGHVLEWYDFAVYGYFAATIGEKFFSSSSEAVQLLASFAVFGVGFVARPLGAVVLGHVGDVHGRRRAFSIALILMGAATLAIGLLPTYQDIGFGAAVALVACRLLQGFSTGGEIGGSIAYLTENAPPHKRGFVGSFQQASLALGMMLGAIVSVVLSVLLTPEALSEWGWRVPFLLGVLMVVPGYFIRRQLADTEEFQAVKTKAATPGKRLPIVTALREHPMDLFRAFWLPASPAYYVLLSFLPTFLATQHFFGQAMALAITLALQAVFVLAMPFAGGWSDRIGRKPVMLTGYAMTGLLVYPVFLAFSTGVPALAFLAIVPMGLALSCMFGPLAALLTEIFPTEIRYSAISLPYNLHSAILGGFTPFVATLLIETTNSPMAPTILVIGIAAICFVVVLSVSTNSKRGQE